MNNLLKSSILLAVLLSLIACGGSKEPQLNTPENTLWKLDFISGLAMDISGLYPGERPVIAFDNATMTLYANTGCNALKIPFTSKGNSLDLAAKEKQSKKACPGPGEPHFLHQLKAVDSFSTKPRQLILYGKGVPLMLFKPTKDEAR